MMLRNDSSSTFRKAVQFGVARISDPRFRSPGILFRRRTRIGYASYFAAQRKWSMPLKKAAFSIVVALSAAVSFALEAGPLFTDNMVLQCDKPVVVWGTAEPGEKVTVEFANQTKSGVASDGGKWQVTLDPMPALSAGRKLIVSSLSTSNHQPTTIHNVVVGEVWLAGGQSNMAFAMQSLFDFETFLPAEANSQVRFIQIPVTDFGEINRNGLTWKTADEKSVRGFSAVAYFFAAELQKRLGVPVGIIGSYRGATWNENWMTPESIKQEPELKYLFENYEKEYAKFKDEAAYEEAYQKFLADLREWEAKGGWSSGMIPFAPLGPKAYQRPSGLYNCMIKPLQPYSIKGCIWYQGEGNAGRYEEFRTLFPAFVEGWRKSWENPDMPFYFVQLPGYGKGVTWPQFRQSQLACSQLIRNCGMVVSEGCNDEADIHPKIKKPIGDRLARAGSAEVSGQDQRPSGPRFKSVTGQHGKAELRVRYRGSGLVLSSDPAGAFEIAGGDKVFVTADVELKGDTLLLWNDSVKNPEYVRYAYSPNPEMVLFNQEGLPASPFTTEMTKNETRREK